MNIIQKEYSKVSRDILISKEYKVIPYNFDRINQFSYFNFNILNNKKLYYDEGSNYELKIQF